MRTTKIKVKRTYKESQKAAIQESLGAVDGVVKVDVDLGKKMISVEHNPSSHGGSALVDQLEKKGFKATIEGFSEPAKK
ncbi:hypothetical protein SUGI_1062800 [Cryptomeria japonica]|nr:hypothetical protein SUGI_1062800 [Cryptomeria japonica]